MCIRDSYYDTETLYEKLDEFGKMPLPPYITKQLDCLLYTSRCV